ncbi:MAG: hypothetical protein EOP50_12535 [Sphingobacteriales bacterium]|nr:MAG: hypothetical protein EOP50_12535 [Sphingobacteriales bacterium]
MRPLLLCFCALSLAACRRNCDDERRAEQALQLESTTTPAQVNHGQAIVARFVAQIPTSCVRFERIEMTEFAPRQLRIEAIGSSAPRRSACADILRLVDTSVVVQTPVVGQYMLHFYSQGLLYKTDTVHVN